MRRRFLGGIGDRVGSTPVLHSVILVARRDWQESGEESLGVLGYHLDACIAPLDW